MENLFVEENLASVLVHGDREIIMSRFGRRGHPNLVAHNHRRGPTAIRNFRLPFDVIRFAPLQGQSDRFGLA